MIAPHLQPLRRVMSVSGDSPIGSFSAMDDAVKNRKVGDRTEGNEKDKERNQGPTYTAILTCDKRIYAAENGKKRYSMIRGEVIITICIALELTTAL